MSAQRSKLLKAGLRGWITRRGGLLAIRDEWSRAGTLRRPSFQLFNWSLIATGKLAHAQDRWLAYAKAGLALSKPLCRSGQPFPQRRAAIQPRHHATGIESRSFRPSPSTDGDPRATPGRRTADRFEWHQRPENVLAGHFSWTDYRHPRPPQQCQDRTPQDRRTGLVAVDRSRRAAVSTIDRVPRRPGAPCRWKCQERTQTNELQRRRVTAVVTR